MRFLFLPYPFAILKCRFASTLLCIVGGVCSKRDATQGRLVSKRDRAWWWRMGGSKIATLAWCNYWTALSDNDKSSFTVDSGQLHLGLSSAACKVAQPVPQGALHTLRLAVLWHGVSFHIGVEVWYNLDYTLWRTDVIKCKFRCTALLIFTPQVYANLQSWCTPEELLA